MSDAPLDPVRLFWEHATELFCVLDADGRFLSVNPAWQRALGYREDQLVGRTAVSLVAEGDRCATASAETLPGTSERVIRDAENRYRHADGSVRWLRWNGYERDGRWYGTAQDVTATRTSDMALRLTERRARAVLEALDDGIVIVDEDGRIMEVNEQFARFTGREVGALLGLRPPYPWWPADESAAMARMLRQFLAGETRPAETVVMHRDGRRLPVLVSVTRLPYERTRQALLVVVRDISELVIVREELLRAHREARLAVWNWYPAEDRLTVFGDGLRPGGATIATMTTADADALIVAGGDELARLRAEVVSGERASFDTDIEMTLAEHHTAPVHVRGEPIVTPQGKVVGVRGTSQAITAPRFRSEAPQDVGSA